MSLLFAGLRAVFLGNDYYLSCFFWQGVCAVLAFSLLIFIYSALCLSPALLQISIHVPRSIACVSDGKINYLTDLVCDDMLDFDVVADISRLQGVRNRKVLSTSCVIAIR